MVTTPQKKPRLFFTEEQKVALRQAYAADPYPNQAAIERLAADVGVGVKTVVNWFHNHRMRAKQQTNLSSGSDSSLSAVVPTSPGSTAVLSSSVKLEDEVSMSDPFTTPNKITTSSYQRDYNELPSDENNDSAFGPAVSTTVGPVVGDTRGPGVNKRKRARPHKLSSDGTVRDCHRGAVDDAPNCGSSVADVAIDLSVLRCTATSVDSLSNSVDQSVSCHQSASCEVAADCDPPPSDDTERERNIERLQKNLTQEPADDWEF